MEPLRTYALRRYACLSTQRHVCKHCTYKQRCRHDFLKLIHSCMLIYACNIHTDTPGRRQTHIQMCAYTCVCVYPCMYIACDALHDGGRTTRTYKYIYIYIYLFIFIYIYIYIFFGTAPLVQRRAERQRSRRVEPPD